MIKSKKIRDSARNESCSLRVHPQCQDDETVVFCHLQSNYRGMGFKSPDLFGVYGCAWCHSWLDSGKVDMHDQMRALQETQMKLYEKELIQVK